MQMNVLMLPVVCVQMRQIYKKYTDCGWSCADWKGIASSTCRKRKLLANIGQSRKEPLLLTLWYWSVQSDFLFYFFYLTCYVNTHTNKTKLQKRERENSWTVLPNPSLRKYLEPPSKVSNFQQKVAKYEKKV